MADQPRVILSGFADEAAHPCDPNLKTAEPQLAVFAALGLQYYTIRFIDAGGGSKNVMALTKAEIQRVRQLQDEYGLNVSSIGSPIGKVKLRDVEDGTKNVYVPLARYLAADVRKACDMAHALEAKLVRGFSFYYPKGTDPREHLAQAVDQLGQIAEVCHRSDLSFGVEVEPSLVGENGYLLAEIYRQVDHPAMLLVFDAANLLVQGYSTAEMLDQFRAMLPGIGWLHVKDCRRPKPGAKGEPADPETPAHYCPCGQGDGAYAMLLGEFAQGLPKLERKLRRRGVPGVFLDLEPRLKRGGQFGGLSGPDGMGVALRSLLRVLDFVGIEYHLRDFDDVKADRGFR